MKSRPELHSSLSERDFLDFYWLKKELQNFCRENGLSTGGSKSELSHRIATYLKTGKVLVKKTKKVSSDFDWDNAQLNRQSVITDNYKNGQNVRDFFQREVGNKFKFNIAFMAWMKTNIGKTLDDAIVEWNRLDALKKDKNYKSEIPPSLEYNRYTRDFYADNPGASRADVIRSWKTKKSLPGHNRYEKSDLDL